MKSETSKMDRISNLPDPLISQILSLLPTKNAVATSVLSTKWKFIWTSVSNLQFDFDCYLWKSHEMRKTLKIKKEKFANFVNRVLFLLNPPSIQNFSLRVCCSNCFGHSYLNSWISAGFKCAVHKFSLYLICKGDNDLLFSQIDCNVAVLELFGYAILCFNIPAVAPLCFPSLQALHLSFIICEIGCNSSVSFPNLKIMHLKSVMSRDDDSVNKLLSSSPVLDDLIIEDPKFYYLDCLVIHIPSLTSLSINAFSDHDYTYKVKINAPALKYLNLIDCLPREYLFVENMSSLLQAHLKWFFDDDDDTNVEGCIWFVKLIERVSRVKFLSVTGSVLKAFRCVSANIIPCFYNLTWLEIEVCDCLDFSMINSFLQIMDNLEHLSLRRSGDIEIGDDICSRQAWWIEPLNVPKCMQLRLTTMCFSGNITGCGCCDQLKLLRYFLKKAKVLQLLTINAYHISETHQLELLKKILLIPRGSQACQVAFTEMERNPFLNVDFVKQEF